MILSDEQAHALAQYALEAAPSEACGLIAGRGEVAQLIVPIPNAASDPTRLFEFEQRAFVQAMFDLERQGLSLIAFYHSHPHHPPIPSTTDIRYAHYPEVVQVIVSLQSATPRLAAWQIRGQTVEPVELYVGAAAVHDEVPEPFSGSQKAAVILSAALTFLLVVLIALALLPPAPVLTR